MISGEEGENYRMGSSTTSRDEDYCRLMCGPKRKATHARHEFKSPPVVDFRVVCVKFCKLVLRMWWPRSETGGREWAKVLLVGAPGFLAAIAPFWNSSVAVSTQSCEICPGKPLSVNTLHG